MSATVDTNTDWQEQAIALRRDQKMATIEIAERFGKSASQVRRVIAQAQTERAINGSNREAEALANLATDGATHTFDEDVEPVARVESQGDIEQALADPEDPLHAFKAEAGESVGDMPPVTPPEAEAVETRYRGTRQTCLDFGPNADLPTGGTLVIRSEKLATGHFGVGDVITGTFTARITGLSAKEKFDAASEEFRAKTTPYEATITEISYEPVDADD